MLSAKPATIEEYIAAFPASTQKVLKQVHSCIKNAAPSAEEAIGYGIPTYKLNGNLVHFGGYKQHVGFYPAPAGIKAFEKELAVYKSSKGAVQFPLNEPMPLTLIAKIVKFRVKQNLEKPAKKK